MYHQISKPLTVQKISSKDEISFIIILYDIVLQIFALILVHKTHAYSHRGQIKQYIDLLLHCVLFCFLTYTLYKVEDSKNLIGQCLDGLSKSSATSLLLNSDTIFYGSITITTLRPFLIGTHVELRSQV